MQTQKFTGIGCQRIVVVMALLWPVVTLGAPQSPPSAPVTVVNQPANPVPVTGSLTITNPSASPIPVTGSVVIEDTVAVRNVDAPAAQFVLSCENLDAFEPSCQTNLVPAGKRMVVQMISANLAGDNLNGSVTPVLYAVRVQQAKAGGTDGVFDLFIPLASVGIYNNSYPFWIGNQRINLYLDEGKGIFGMTAVARTGTSQGSLSIFVYGYLVDK